MDKRTPDPFPTRVALTAARHGQMLYMPNDLYVGRSFQAYGEFSEGEVDIFSRFVKPGDIVLDIGANIGAHTVPLAQLAGAEGMVLAFEPQPNLFQMLCANLALNSVPNVLAQASAVGNRTGTCVLPVPDFSATTNFGALSVDAVSEGEVVPITRIDNLNLPRLDFIKLDVEGHEAEVLKGGVRTITRFKPVIYLENDRRDKSENLIQLLFTLGYNLWWHTPPLFNPDNFKGNPENLFPTVASLNMLAIHDSRDPIDWLREVTSETDWVLPSGPSV